MKTLQLSDAAARNLYPKAEPEFKQVLEDTFGAGFFSQKITERVKTYTDACEEAGIDPLTLFDFNILPEVDRKSAFAYHQLTIIAKALNEGWQPDWSNTSEYKYYPWFKAVSSGSRFSFRDFGRDLTFSGVGSRLVFKNSDLATYAGNQFLDIYNDFLTL